MTSTLVATTPVDLHLTPDGVEVMLIGRDGARTTGDRAGLEMLTPRLIAHLWGDDARVVVGVEDEDDADGPDESEYETLGPGGWDRPSRGPA